MIAFLWLIAFFQHVELARAHADQLLFALSLLLVFTLTSAREGTRSAPLLQIFAVGGTCYQFRPWFDTCGGLLADNTCAVVRVCAYYMIILSVGFMASAAAVLFVVTIHSYLTQVQHVVVDGETLEPRGGPRWKNWLGYAQGQ
jgi:hypothetical protein